MKTFNTEILEAARKMDWQQVILNGGPPCFFMENGRFCGRASRWAGHGRIGAAFAHEFFSLEDLLRQNRAIQLAMLKALRFIANRENLMFAECSDAEEIISVARAAISQATTN